MDDKWHEAQYKAALKAAEYNGPEWADLSDEAKAAIRRANLAHRKFMNALGDAIVNGTPLPNPMEQDDDSDQR